MGNLVKKTQVAPFVNAGTSNAPDWARIKKSTAFVLALNPQTKTFDFISSDVAEEEIESYQPSLSQDITMFKGERDYQIFFDMLFDLPTGEKAHKDLLLVFYQEETEYTPAGAGASVKAFKAWKTDSLVKINQMDTVNENITVDFSLKEPTKGIVIIENKKPVFIEGEFTDEGGSEPQTVTHTVTFDADGGTGTDPADETVADGGTFRLPANPYTPPTDKHFKAWEVDGAEHGAGEDITVTDDVIVKAVWEDNE